MIPIKNIPPGTRNGRIRLLQGLILLAVLPLVLMGCWTTTAKVAIEPPWMPDVSGQMEDREPPVGQVAPVFWLEDGVAIDGVFTEWRGLVSAQPYVVVYGSGFIPADASGDFTMATDGSNLFLYADITDDVPNENKLPPAGAWRNDSVEFFIGTDTTPHRDFTPTDTHIRVVPASKTDPAVYSLSINDVDFTKETDARVRFRENGYRIEAAIPLALLGISELRLGQKLRVEFQINDGDSSERDRLIHWMSEKDDPYFDASVWGDAEIVLPQEAAQ